MNAYSHSNDRARLSPMHARRRPHSDGVFTPADTAELTVPRLSGRPSSMVEQVRELAKEARRQAQLESSSLTRGHFETPQSYRDDTDDHTLIAAPAPSVSPNAMGRIDYIQRPSRSISRLDQYECEELSLSGQIYVLSHLTFFSILGTAARIGLDRLVSYPGAPSVIPVLWPNFVASFLLGLIVEDRNLSIEGQDLDGPSSTLEKARLVHLQSNMNMPLFVGLTAGFCGCLDTFAAVMLDAFLALANSLPTPINHPYPSGAVLPSTFSTVHRNAGYSLAALLAVLILNICLSLSALKCGAQLALSLHGRLPAFSINVTWTINRLMVPLAFLTWVGVVIMSVFPPDRPGGPDGEPSWGLEKWRGTFLFALVFAPLGCITRYFLSKHLNGVSECFPLGSFCANVFGTVVLGMAYDLQHTPLGQGISSGVGGGLIGCQVLQGVIDGFCGGLTTVAALSAEVVRLERKGWLYGVSSLAGAGALLIVVMGPVKWTIGYGEPVCALVTS
jgi:CrcB protein